jgi:23S rRNA pseudouridine1911/1915/1917 synthase
VEKSEQEESIIEMHLPPGYQAGERLDQYLAENIAGMSRSKVHRAIKQERVTINGEVETKPSRPVQAGDRLAIRLQRPPRIEAEPEAIPLDILYEDDVLLVVNKPAGMVVHPAYGHRGGTLVNALLHHVGAGPLSFEKEDDGGGDDDHDDEDEIVGLSTVTAAPKYEGDTTVRPGIVHRLDKDTSGLLVVAKTDAAHAHLGAQFMNRTIRRRYLAIVWGTPDPPEGTIDTFVGRDARDRKRTAVVGEDRGKRAITHYEVLEPLGYTSLVRFRLETGRTHQIRVHAAYMGNPVLGDVTYHGDRIRYGVVTANRKKFFHNLLTRMPRQALHAQSLGFQHPVTGEEMRFEAPLPEDMEWVLQRLRAVEGKGIKDER